MNKLCGFEYPTSGEILFKGNNIAFGLKVKKMDKELIDKKVKEMLSLVNLNGFEKRSINSLSGGQQQRIAIPDLAYAVPKGGSNFFVDAMVIPKTSKHKQRS